MRNLCDLIETEATDILIQGYRTTRKFSRIDKGSMPELFSVNATLKKIKLIRCQTLRAIGIG